MRIAFFADPHSPGGWYRGIGPIVALQQRGHEIRQVMRLDGSLRPDVVDGADVLVIHRYHDKRAMQLVQTAKQGGVAVVWDNDDDLSTVPRGKQANRYYGGLHGERALSAVRRILLAADLVTTPSSRLAEQFRGIGAHHVAVIENYVRDELIDSRGDTSTGEVVVGWLAGLEHHVDIEHVPIRAALASLMQVRPEVRVVTIGVGLGLPGDRYRHVRRVPFAELEREIGRFDVGIAPIADIPFNRARSNVKLKEYAAVGVPWLASPVGAYALLGEKQGGRLVPDDAWTPTLEWIVENSRVRRRLAKRATRWGRGQTISANIGEWETRLREAIALGRARSS